MDVTVWRRRLLIAALCLPIIGIGAYWVVVEFILVDPFRSTFAAECGSCHGDALEGGALGPALAGVPLRHGESTDDIERAIREGIGGSPGMPGFANSLDALTIRQMALYVAEQRESLLFFDYRIDAPLGIPAGRVDTEVHSFHIEQVVSDLDPLPFSFALLPEGGYLVTEKIRGLSRIGPNGSRTLISDTPRAWDAGFEMPIVKVEHGHGWMFEVATHPDYDANGWIYLHYADRCPDCNALALETGEEVSMNRLDRGRIEGDRWVDGETIWQAEPDTYTAASDLGAGGRIAFDDQGHVYFSVGLKGAHNHDGIQDLDQPYGKVHRVRDDGGIPADNPFLTGAHEAGRATVWTYGHRVVQGLEWAPSTQLLWSTEMGPRGGDEINVLRPGGNHGWPLVSLGLDYAGTPVEYGIELGIDPGILTLVAPVVDLTPSPAVSSFIIYDEDAFPEWRGSLIVGTLKATDLERFVFDGTQPIARERLLDGIGRVRDIEVDALGQIHLLIEHREGSRILRLAPAD